MASSLISLADSWYGTKGCKMEYQSIETIITEISASIMAIATIFIAISSYRSYQTAKQMLTLSEEISNNSKQYKKTTQKITDEYRTMTQKLILAIVISNLIEHNSANLKNNFGILLRLFKYEQLKNTLGFTDDDFRKLINSDNSKVVEQILRNISNPGSNSD